MVDWNTCSRLCGCFPRSFINGKGEFIAHEKTNQYIILADINTEFEVKCKLLEWFSRPAYKTEPYATKRKNDELHRFMLDGINTFLGTDFTADDMEIIYTYLGNACNHAKTIRFIESGYGLEVLKNG